MTFKISPVAAIVRCAKLSGESWGFTYYIPETLGGEYTKNHHTYFFLKPDGLYVTSRDSLSNHLVSEGMLLESLPRSPSPSEAEFRAKMKDLYTVR